MAEVVCPWCFGTFDSLKMQFRCINPRCGKEKDEPYSEYHGLTTPRSMARVMDPVESVFERLSNKDLDSVPCSSCSVETNKKICPLCHNQLPDTAGKHRHYIIVVVGSKESGKSHFIAVLLNSLRQEIGADLDASLMPLNDDTIERYQREFYDPIFRDRTVLDATRSLAGHSEGKAPLIFCLKLRQRGMLGRDHFEVMTLVFFDTAGEDLDNVDLLQVEAKYIARADGIIFLVDPLQIPAVRDHTSGVPLPGDHTDPATIVGKLARVVRGVRHMDVVEPIRTPLAFTLSKIDAVQRMLPPGSSILGDSGHGNRFDVRGFERSSQEIRSRLCDWYGDSGALVRDVEHNFRDCGYFAVSALGSSPDSTGQLGLGVAPFRIGDPLLWLMWKRGLIDDKDERGD
ncbi:hypothetical protein ACFL5T_01775 [Gemmatimonadota bacterium]